MSLALSMKNILQKKQAGTVESEEQLDTIPK